LERKRSLWIQNSDFQCAMHEYGGDLMRNQMAVCHRYSK